MVVAAGESSLLGKPLATHDRKRLRGSDIQAGVALLELVTVSTCCLYVDGRGRYVVRTVKSFGPVGPNTVISTVAVAGIGA